MLPVLGPSLIAGAGSLLSGFMSSTTSAENVQAQIAAQSGMQQQAEQFNAGQAQVARDYETQMSNTAYQRASKDMQAAGLNPMMMFGSGGAASTPSSPSPSIGPQQVPIGAKANPLAGVGDAVSKAVTTAVDMKQIEQMTQAIANLKTQGRLTEANIRTEAQRPEQVAAITTLEQNQAKLAKLAQEPALWSAKQAGDLNAMPDAVRKTGSYVGYGADKISDMLAPFVSGAGALRGWRSSVLRDKIDKGNFIGRYGTPVDEYLAQ